jgi:hypothetical protein
VTRLAVVLLAGASCGSCLSLRHIDAGLEHVRSIVRQQDCHDGAPARVLVDPRCEDGICGVTCAPDRWWPVHRKEPES